jgi:ABC-type bacteriocin/lantibiotic exporter with double-glycine peptidase domain
VRVPFPVKRSCAADSLYFCLHVNKAEGVTLAETEKQLPVGYEGVSAADILRASESFGVPAAGLRSNLRELAGLHRPCILHVNDDHFITFVRVDGDRLILFDNTLGLINCSESWFRHQYAWRGDAIVIGTRTPGWLSFLQSEGFLLFSAGVFLTACGVRFLLATTTGRLRRSLGHDPAS